MIAAHGSCLAVERDAVHGGRSALGQAIRSRPFRVIALGSAIAVMSTIDLYLTLLYLTHSGMPEANPLARAMIAYQSPFVLAVWKTLTVVLCVGILFLIRHKRSAEFGAWAAVCVLAMLMSHWARYASELADYKPLMAPVAAQIDDTWVHIQTDRSQLIP
ncbi:MAG: DUF5658 family protein [Planctomycetota bacterium]